MKKPGSLNSKMILCGLIVVGVVYQLVMSFMVNPWLELSTALNAAKGTYTEKKRKTDRIPTLQARWDALAARTFPERSAHNNVDALMKQLLGRSGLDHLVVKPGPGPVLPKTKVQRVNCAITAEGSLPNVVKFLWSLYTEPLLSRVTRFRITPVDSTGGGYDMKIEMQVETLVFPESFATASAGGTRGPARSVSAASQPNDLMRGLPRLRAPRFAAAEYEKIAERNIFAAYEPPPKAFVRVQSDDRLPINVTIKSFWEDKEVDTKTFKVDAKKTAESPVVEGNRITVVAAYEDKQTFSAPKPFEVRQRFDPSTHRFDFRVPSHTPPPPPPPPDSVQVVINNQDDKTIEISIEREVDGAPLKLAPIKVSPRSPHRLERMKTKKITLAVKYEGGGAFGPKSFFPAKDSQEFNVPPKPIEPSKNTEPEVVAKPEEPDPAADVNLKVTGLWTYPGGAELIATDVAKHKRRLFQLDDTLDGGKLIFVHPFGGIVKMPSGHFYMYPLGRGFTDRALLEARTEEQLPAAVMIWNVKDAEVPPHATADASGGGAPAVPPRRGGFTPADPRRPNPQNKK